MGKKLNTEATNGRSDHIVGVKELRVIRQLPAFTGYRILEGQPDSHANGTQAGARLAGAAFAV